MKKPKTPKSAPAPQPNPDLERIRLVVAYVYILDTLHATDMNVGDSLWDRLVNSRPQFQPGDYKKLFPSMPRPSLHLDDSEPVTA